MVNDKSFHLGLLYLTHLLINADGFVNEEEERALQKIKEKEKIPLDVFKEFIEDVKTKTTKSIYNDGVALLNKCDDTTKLNALAHMYKLTEIDGSVHVKEVRLLLYAIKMTAVEFDDVVMAANKIRY